MFDTPSNLPVEPLPSTDGTSSVSSVKKEPEDMFANLDQADAPSSPEESSFLNDPPPGPSKGKVAVLIIVGFIALAGIGSGVWYFFVRDPGSVLVNVPSSSSTPVVVVSQEEPIVEVPPVLSTNSEPEAVVITPTSVPITSPPPGTNVPPPESLFQPTTTTPPMEGKDMDGDGITDAEEALLGTSLSAVDSDGDGYKDGDEVKSGYDPAMPRLKIGDSVKLKSATFASEGFLTLIPTAWDVGRDEMTGGSFADTKSGARFETGPVFDAKSRSTSTPFTLWLAAQVKSSGWPEIDPDTLQSFTTKTSLPAWKTPDGLLTFIQVGDSVVSVRYRVSTSSVYDFRTLYDIFVQYLRPLAS